ncbi:FBD-associated F-box protein At4g10400-like [Papaver somniferum]|uniref:FBD-associated F-box protein At4g10400-like n=1 Tax=Papaver somniferum TaxID=3469 RepID=UPI000E6F73C4|nr:FBD-associated F-box protein At4g10400-like [Papaver somniferum]
MEEIRNEPCSDREDRISRLEDALIHYILSFIDPKYAVQTSVLSKRWIDIWKSLTFLSFYRSSFSQDKKDSFVMFVDMVFIFRRKDIDVQRFRLDWSDSAYDDSVTVHVNRWCLNAIGYNVQEVRILITQFYNSAYEFPHRLFNCKSLRMLVIEVCGNARYVDVILPRSMNLPQLKVLAYCGLSISGVEFSKSLFPSCPVLETLHVVDFDIHNDKGRNLIVVFLSALRSLSMLLDIFCSKMIVWLTLSNYLLQIWQHSLGDFS